MKKKLIGFALAFALVLGIIPTTGFAATTNELLPSANESAAIVATLQYLEEDKSSFDLNEVEFDNLQIGNKLFAYEYTENGFDELYLSFPIFYNGEIVALATKVSENNFQISVGLAYKLNEIRNSNIALIYDSDAVYAFDGDSFSLLGTSPVTIPHRQSFRDGFPDTDMVNVKLCGLKESARLHYTTPVKTRAQTYFSCPVKYVPQGEGTNMCWAATIACIVNYVSNKNLTAKDVAVREYGSTNYDQGMTTANSAKVLRNTYKLDYTYLNHAPSETVFLENIQTGYPLYGSFGNDHISHAATIFGINIVSGYITVMDPLFGSTTAYHSSNGFSYVNTAMGETITLGKTICSVWEEE